MCFPGHFRIIKGFKCWNLFSCLHIHYADVTFFKDQFFSSSDMSSNLDVVADFSTALFVPVIMSHDISRYLFRPETIEGVLLLCNADK